MTNMANPIDPESLDVQIGQLIRALRIAKGWSQEDLSKRVGLSYQQIQKYEKGHSRILASKLYEFASVFGVDVSYFYHGMPEALAGQEDIDVNKIFRKDTWKVAAKFERIEDKETRNNILDLVTTLARNQ